MTTVSTRERPETRRRPLPRYAWLVPVALTVFSVWAVRAPLSLLFKQYSGMFIDLEVYRLGIDAMRSGGDMYGDLPKVVGIELPFIYPPFAAIVLQPLALLPWDTAVIVYFVTSVLALTAALYAVARLYWTPGLRALYVTACAVPLAVLLEPVWGTLDFGQVNLLLMGLVVAGCLWAQGRWWGGALVGIAAAIKLTPAAFVLYFLIRKDYKSAAIAAGTGAGATLLAFAILPGQSMTYWFGGLGNIDDLSGSEYATNQTIQGILARYQVDGFAFDALWVLLSLALLAVVIAAMRKAADAPALAVSINAAFALLVSPISWSHHWVWIAPALLGMIGYATTLPRDRARGWWVTIVATTTVFVLAPHFRIPINDERELYWSVWEQIVGNSYVITAVTLLALWLYTGRNTPEKAQVT